MLLVKARTGTSKIHGLGLIAQEFIPKGACIWRFQPGFDLMLSEVEFQALSAPAQEQVQHYSFFDEARKVYVLSGDDDRFTNHSDTPNTLEAGGYQSYAIQDIQAGEEITWNYRGWGDYDFLASTEDKKQ